MEITRNDRTARVMLPLAQDASEIKKVVFENQRWAFTFGFGLGEPTDSTPSDIDRYVDYDSGAGYSPSVSGSVVNWNSAGQTFNPTDYSILVPLPMVTHCGKFNVRWEYEVTGGFADSFIENQQYDVIQPLFTPAQLKAFDDDFIKMDVSDHAIKRLERVVRAVIERATGQKFELSYSTETARSYNGTSLMLPKRAVALEGYSGYIAGVRAMVESDGWIVRAEDPNRNVHMTNANPIYDIYTNKGFSEERYRLTGEWGYRSIPNQIQLAAMILAQDYGCRESVWRDRYVEMMKNVDWSIQYHDKAFEGTGNIKVDQILQSYILNRMVVV